MVLIRKKLLFSDKVFVYGQSGFIRAKWLNSVKVVVFGQKWLYSGKKVVFGQSSCVREKVVLFR